MPSHFRFLPAQLWDYATHRQLYLVALQERVVALNIVFLT